MNRKYFILLIIFLAALAAAVYVWSRGLDGPGLEVPVSSVQNEETGGAVDLAAALEGFARDSFTGDLEGMIERRMIRVLVTFNKTHYFVDQGTQKGIYHEMFSVFEDELNAGLKNRHIRVNIVFIPVARDELEEALIQGQGDVAAANLTITPGRSEKVDFTDPLFTNVCEIVVTGPGAEPVNSVEDLSGKEVYIRKSSSFYESLKELNKDFQDAGKMPVMVNAAPEVLETEDILEMVNAGLVEITIADSHLAEFWAQIFENITLHPEAAVKSGREIGIMIRKNSPELKQELNEFLSAYREGTLERNVLLQKYLKNTRYAREMTSPEEMARFEAMVEIFRKYGDKYDLDHLLMMAQGYQESRLDQSARSPSGAIGVMQLLRSTGEEMDVGDITQLEPNIHAGVKYVRFMIDHYFADEPMDELNKGLMAMASYNAGPTRISRLRREAQERGLDPNIWFNNVEIVVAENIGRETVQYVSNVYKYYLAYTMIAEQARKRERVKSEKLL